jgi:16S rRNA (guanine(966)-N(2))-methyltransferase RsmD
VRITGGIWASRPVAGPGRTGGIRPTPDALREQALALLQPLMAGAVFLDLFAGTGVVSLEALSRGAARAVLVETSRTAAALITRNMAALGAPRGERWELLKAPARRAVGALASRGVRADIVWCDPPFTHWELGGEALVEVWQRGVLTPACRIILEVPPRCSGEVPGFRVVRELRGAVVLQLPG